MLVMLTKIILELLSRYKIRRVGRTVWVMPESSLHKRGLVLDLDLEPRFWAAMVTLGPKP